MRLIATWGIIGVILGAPCSASDYAIYVVDPPITDYPILQEGPLPPVCKQTNTIKLSGCRGQYEPASFVVEASGPLEAVRVEVLPLSGPGGTWPKDAVDVRVVKDYYRSPAVMPRLLVYDENFLAVEPAPTESNPTAMKNIARGELRDAPSLQPVRIELRKQFWITVHIPQHAEAGIYKTAVRITPENNEPSDLELEVEVFPFELLEPMLEYSIYYPAYLEAGFPSDHQFKFVDLSSQQYALELRNMVAHGIDNPNIYESVEASKDGTLDFTKLEKILELRESVGMRPNALYLLGHPILYENRPLTADERERNHKYVRQINEWADQRGYEDVFFHAIDERIGEQLSAEHDSMLSVKEAGGKTFVALAMENTFFERVGDVLQRPVFELRRPQLHMERFIQKNYTADQVPQHMGEIGEIGASAAKDFAEDPEIRRMIDSVNRLGNRIFSYTTGVNPLPRFQRCSTGLGLWRMGFGGVMNWAYTHNSAPSDCVDQEIVCAMVYRTENGVLDTLLWEGFRQGVDDVRYLTTLLDTLNRVRGTCPDEALVRETGEWVNGIDVFHGDLDDLRRQMAQRIVALLNLGPAPVPSDEQVLAGIDLERVQVIALAKPWRWKMDADDTGVRDKWYEPGFDDTAWDVMPDIKNTGWGTAPGFGWYRTELSLTDEVAVKKSVYLYFAACDEDAWVYLNGQKVFEHSCETTGLFPEEIWRRPFVVPLTDMKLHGNDLLAVRVYNTGGMGGIWKPVHLIMSDQNLTEQQIHALMKQRQGGI